jgi:hypothetical protein
MIRRARYSQARIQNFQLRASPGRDTAKSLREAVTCGGSKWMMCQAWLRVAGGARAERWKFSRSPSSVTRDARPPMPSSPIPAARSHRDPAAPVRHMSVRPMVRMGETTDNHGQRPREPRYQHVCLGRGLDLRSASQGDRRTGARAPLHGGVAPRRLGGRRLQAVDLSP